MLNESICWTPGMTLKDVELLTVRYAFRYYKEIKTSTAKALGVSIRTLDSKLIELNLMEKRAEWVAAERRRESEIYLHRARGQEVPEHLLVPTPMPKADEVEKAEPLTLPKREAQTVLEGQEANAVGV